MDLLVTGLVDQCIKLDSHAQTVQRTVSVPEIIQDFAQSKEKQDYPIWNVVVEVISIPNFIFILFYIYHTFSQISNELRNLDSKCFPNTAFDYVGQLKRRNEFNENNHQKNTDNNSLNEKLLDNIIRKWNMQW